jgi:hypothetical protein
LARSRTTISAAPAAATPIASTGIGAAHSTRWHPTFARASARSAAAR